MLKNCVYCVLLSLFAILLFNNVAMAVCPVCTVAIGAGLEGARMLGVEDVISGIWAGGLTVSLIGWTANYMKQHNVKNVFWYVLNIIVYVLLLAGVYMFPSSNPIVSFGDKCMWGIDQFLLGAICGAITFIIMQVWYSKIKQKNGGHAQFPFQKVVMPFSGLLIMTAVFWAIIKWLPQIGIVLC